MSKHTPGPWEVGTFDIGRAGGHVEGLGAIAVSVAAPHAPAGAAGKIRLVALCGDAQGILAEESIADAHLIAAAPLMLKTLKALRDGLREMGGGPMPTVDAVIELAEG